MTLSRKNVLIYLTVLICLVVSITSIYVSASAWSWLKSTSPDMKQPTVDVNIETYTGKWFEAARLPNNFQQDCSCTTAQYDLLPGLHDGWPRPVSVYNRCVTPHGISEGKGKAWPVGKGLLAVSFFPGSYGSYRIIYYTGSVSIVYGGENTMWVLTRSRDITLVDKRNVIEFLKRRKLPFDRLQWSDNTVCTWKTPK
jgi:apolipoprotein D and lipocalin family protein